MAATRHVSFPDENELLGTCYSSSSSSTGMMMMEQQIMIPTVTTIMIDDPTPIIGQDEFKARWFTQQELHDILLECKKTVASSSDHDVVQEIDSSLRGLEMVVTGYHHHHHHNKDPSFVQRRREWTLTLLKNQQYLRETSKDGSVDPVMLADTMKHISEHRQRVAHMRGLQDAQVVQCGDSTSGFGTMTSHTFDLDKHAELRKKKRSQRNERRGRPTVIVRIA